MARTKVNENVTERLANRVAVLLMAAENGNQTAQARLDTIVWTLKTCGYSEEYINGVREAAEEIAGES